MAKSNAMGLTGGEDKTAAASKIQATRRGKVARMEAARRRRQAQSSALPSTEVVHGVEFACGKKKPNRTNEKQRRVTFFKKYFLKRYYYKQKPHLHAAAACTARLPLARSGQCARSRRGAALQQGERTQKQKKRGALKQKKSVRRACTLTRRTSRWRAPHVQSALQI